MDATMETIEIEVKINSPQVILVFSLINNPEKYAKSIRMRLKPHSTQISTKSKVIFDLDIVSICRCSSNEVYQRIFKMISS